MGVLKGRSKMGKTFRPFRIHGEFEICHAHVLMWNYQGNWP